MIFSTFTTTLKAYTRGNEYLDNIHHADFVMEQLVMSLRSAAHFESAPGLYGMRLEDQNAGRHPGDAVSFVTASKAFMPVDSELQGLHRIQITIGDDKNGDPGVVVRAMPFLTTKEEDDFDPYRFGIRARKK
ncbi:MAG: hypothetical protein AAF492_00690 [Verrucomicrobiota bacterium]